MSPIKKTFTRSSTCNLDNQQTDSPMSSAENPAEVKITDPTSKNSQIPTSPSKNDKTLGEDLSASVSPSPFAKAEMKEESLQEMVNSTKSLFRPFCVSEQSPLISLKKKELQDYILHALQSICIIKKLKPVSDAQISTRKLTLPVLKNGTQRIA
jgi:hypothetical protein